MCIHAWVHRFINNCRINGELHSDEIQESEIIIIKACQQKMFSEEYKAMMSHKHLPCNSKLLVLNPCLDDDGLM